VNTARVSPTVIPHKSVKIENYLWQAAQDIISILVDPPKLGALSTEAWDQT